MSETDKTIREATTWRTLRALVLGVLCRDLGKRPIDLSELDAERLLEPWDDYLKHYFDIFVEISAHAKAEALRTMSIENHARASDHFDPHHTEPANAKEEPPHMPLPRHGRW